MGTRVEIHGTVAPGFEPVRDAFAANWVHQGEVGASVAVTVGGEPVVDLWAGIATYDDGERPWNGDTIINVWSTTKTMSFLCCLLQVDRGLLDLYEPVATYWPEFAQAGKEHIATRHILAHTAGLSGWDEPLEFTDLLDHQKLVDIHARQAPWWEPGTASGYHAISQGYLLGEIVKRTDPTGRSIGQFFADEIAGPLDADFHIGLAPEHDARVAHVIPPADPLMSVQGAANTIAARTVTNPHLDASYSQRHDWRRAEVPAAGGHGNARSIARIHALTANGGEAFGQSIMSADTIQQIFDEQIDNTDLVLQLPIRLGMGFGLKSDAMPLPNEGCCFWGGWGGSLAVADTENHVSFAYAMNRMDQTTTGDLRAANLLGATYAALT